MSYRTVDQKADGESIAKAGELIEIRGTGDLSLHDRRVLNLLYQAAGDRICDDVQHEVPIVHLRGSHKGGERVKDSILHLMRTVVEVPVKGRNNRPATLRVQLLSDTTVSDDDADPTGLVVFSFSKGMREVIQNSTHWGRIRGSVVFALTSKYSLALYELIALRINLQHRWQEQFSVEQFRALLGVPKDKLLRSPDLLRYCIQPAELEVNGLADFGVRIELLRAGGKERGALTGFKVSWWRKELPELQAAYAELQRSKVGRIPRLKGTVQETVPPTVAAALEDLRKSD